MTDTIIIIRHTNGLYTITSDRPRVVAVRATLAEVLEIVEALDAARVSSLP